MVEAFPVAASVTVVSAMPEELAPLRAMVSDLGRGRAGSLAVDRGRLAGRSVSLCVTGDGARRARDGATALLAASRPDGLLVLGVAGALSPGLGTGSLVVAARVMAEDGRSWAADPEEVTAAAKATGAKIAVVVSADHLADTAREKERLRRLSGENASPAVVDLESASYVAAAVEAGIPWLCLRAVSDTAAESLPGLLNRSRDGGGAVRRGQVLLRLLREPQELPFLLALRARTARCAEVLAGAAVAALPAFARRAAPLSAAGAGR